MQKSKQFWDGVCNNQARNLMRDDIKIADEIVFIIPIAKNEAL